MPVPDVAGEKFLFHAKFAFRSSREGGAEPLGYRWSKAAPLSRRLPVAR